MNKQEVARWEVDGQQWIVLWRYEDGVYTYRHSNGGGGILPRDFDGDTGAMAYMEDSILRSMRRVA